MADPIEVAVPKTAAEAKEVQAKLAKLESEVNTFLDSNETDWSPEHQEQFERMQGDERAYVDALDTYFHNAEEADKRRKSVSGAAERYEAMLRVRNGGSRQSLRDRARAAEQLDDIDSLSDADLVNLAVSGFIAQVTDRSPDQAQSNAMVENERRLKQQIVDRQSRVFGNRVITVDSVPDDFVSYLQFEAARGLDIRNVLSTTNPASAATGSGSPLFGPSFVTDLEAARLHYGGMNQVADIMTTDSGELLSWPTVNDTANKGRVIAPATAPTATDPSFGLVQWSAFKLSSDEIIVNRELIEDNQVRLLSRLSAMLGERLGRKENQLFTTGAGTTEPTGIVTAATQAFTSASNAGLTFDEIIDLEHSIDPSRRGPGNVYMFHDSTLLLVRKLKDGNSNYLWQSGANTGAPATLNGHRYVINQDMDQFNATAGKKPVIYGDMKMFKIRRVRGVRLVVTDELYSRTDQVAFFAWVRVDSNLLDAGDNPVQYIETAA